MVTKKVSRKVSIPDIKMLYGFSAARCNICENLVFEPKIGSDGYIHLGEMAHNIAHSNKDTAPRFIDGESGDNSYNNLILLCANDHKRVDQDTIFYNSEYLRNKKNEFEQKIRSLFLNNSLGLNPDDKWLIKGIFDIFPIQKIYSSLDYAPDKIHLNILEILDIRNILEDHYKLFFPFKDNNLNNQITNLFHSVNELKINYFDIHYFLNDFNHFFYPKSQTSRDFSIEICNQIKRDFDNLINYYRYRYQ